MFVQGLNDAEIEVRCKQMRPQQNAAYSREVRCDQIRIAATRAIAVVVLNLEEDEGDNMPKVSTV